MTTDPRPTDPAPTRHDEAGLLAAFGRYERALAANDLAVLDELFAPGGETVRADGGSALVGAAHIAAFRAGRGGAPARWLRRVHVRWVTGDDAHVVAETRRVGGSGLQTQWWRRTAGVWRVHAAHVSGAPTAPTAPPDGAVDPARWRVHVPGGAIVPGSGRGALHGVTLAVKDLVAVAGHRVGAGVPAWLAAAEPEAAHAPALQRLLDAGAELTGIAQTDELAFSLMGVNEHHGTPSNPAAPGRVPGGSTSGPASAVAAGEVDLGLGTDTAGSLRVPGSYCGLYAWRPTHGAVPVDGVLPLAQDFDAVGLLARRAPVLHRAGLALLGSGPGATAPTGSRPNALLRSRTLMALATPETALAVEAALTALAVQLDLPVVDLEPDVDPEDAAAWTVAFRTVQTAQAWANHGAFLEADPGAVSASVEARFRSGRAVSAADLDGAREAITRTRTWLDGVLAQGWLCLPSTSTPAPPVDAGSEEVELARTGTLQLTTLASQTGVPALGLPWGRVGPLPVGLCLLAPRGADADLLGLLDALAPPEA